MRNTAAILNNLDKQLDKSGRTEEQRAIELESWLDRNPPVLMEDLIDAPLQDLKDFLQTLHLFNYRNLLGDLSEDLFRMVAAICWYRT